MGWLQAAPRFGGAFVFVLCYTERMNLYDQILASKPDVALKLNSAGTAFIDATNRATVAGTQLFTNSIVTGNSKSLLAKNANLVNFNTSVYNAKSTYNSFTLEAWYRPLYFSTGEITIISHPLSEYDGLTADLDNIYFRVKFATNTAELKWSIPDQAGSYHVVGTYSPGKIQLYIDGLLVAEKDISDYLVQGIKAFGSNNLYIGQSSYVNMQAAVDGVAVYTRVLSDAEIYRHFLAGRRVLTIDQIAQTFGGTSYDSTARDPFFSKSWNTMTDWLGASYTDVEFTTGYLRPINDDTTGLSRAGVWTGQYETSTATTLYGVILDWDADGSFLVQASLDRGATWVPVTNGRVIAGTFGWTTGEYDLLIRVTFAGGIANDISSIRSLRARAYTSPTVYGSYSTRTLTVNTGISTSAEQTQPIEGIIDAGFTSAVNGTIIINPDTDPTDAQPVSTIEMWHKFDVDPAGKFIFDARPGGGTAYLWAGGGTFGFAGASAVYVNGAAITAGTFTPVQGVWYHLVFVSSAPITTKIDITAVNRGISVLNVYPTALTASDVALMYLMYADYPSAKLGTDASPITEGANPYTLYAFDWSIASTG